MDLILQKYGNPILRQKAEEVTTFNEELRLLGEKMLEVMYQNRGIGLAAEQAGRLERIFVIDIPPAMDMDENGQRENPTVSMPLFFINPSIINHSTKKKRGVEGCLSFPGMQAEVERWSEVEAEFLDLNGNKHNIKAKGLLARAIQHELDHLNGVLFIDHISPVKKILLDSKLKRLIKETKKDLGLN